MLSSRNLLKPADGEPIIGPSKDMVLGVYYLTMDSPYEHLGHGRVFANMDEVEMAYQLEQLDIHAKIKVKVETYYDEDGNRMEESETRMIETSVGRVLFNKVLAPKVQFMNYTLDKGGVKDLIAEVLEVTDEVTTTEVADKIKDVGFKYATRSGITVAVSDITIPDSKAGIVSEAMEAEEGVDRDYRRGLLTEQEQNERVIEIWQKATDDISQAVKETMDPPQQPGYSGQLWRW